MQSQIKAQDLQIRALEASTKAKAVDASIERDHARHALDIVTNAYANAMDLMPGAE